MTAAVAASNAAASATDKKNAGPGYYDLIKEAVLTLKERSGSSRHAIDKYVAAKKGAAYSKSRLNMALKKGVETGKLVPVKGSYKLSADEKKENKKAVAGKKPVKKVDGEKKAKTAMKKNAPKKSVGKKDKITKKTDGAKKKVAKSVKKVTAKKPTTTKKKVVKKSTAAAVKKAAKKAEKKA